MSTSEQHLQTNCTENPKQKAGVLSLLTFWWLEKLLRQGYKRPLTGEDLPSLLNEDQSSRLVETLEQEWKQEVHDCRIRGVKPRLWKAALRMIPVRYYLVFIFQRLFFSLAFVSTPVIVWFFLRGINSSSGMDYRSLFLQISLLGLAAIIKTLTEHHSSHTGDVWSVRIKVATVGLIYKKILSMKRNSLQRILSGNTINLVSNDAQKIEMVGKWIGLVLSAPIEIAVSCFMLWYLIGWQALVGLVPMLLNLLYNIIISKVGVKLRQKVAKVTDQRLAVVNEIVSGIRALKIGAWEENYCGLVKVIRRQEMRLMRLRGIIRCTVLACISCTLTMAVLVSLFTMVVTKLEVTSFTVFTMMSFMAVIKYSVSISLGECLLQVAEMVVGLNRMEAFLEGRSTQSNNTSNEDFCNKDKIDKSLKPISVYYKGIKYVPQVLRLESFRSEKPTLLNWRITTGCTSSRTADLSISLDNVSCNWNDISGRQTLKNITLNVTGSQLVVVTGPVGSGKSSLLMAILGELPIHTGKISSAEDVAYVSQTPWVFSGTVRENIVFGRPFDEAKYLEALQVCDLLKDITQFAKGDSTRIGERGVSLSGGQRARVSLARAVYSQADVYLLDDPLSAVDTKVGRHLFERCICGVLSGRLRVLTTHQLQYLKMADHIVVLDDGSIVEAGSYDELERNKVMEPAQLVGDGESTEAIDNGGTSVPSCMLSVGMGFHKDLEEGEEDKMVGSITWRLYWDYFRQAVPAAVVITMFLSCVCAQVALVAPNWWLARMTSEMHDHQENLWNTGILAILFGVSLVMICLSGYIVNYTTLMAPEKLHNKMVTTITHAPVLFFDTNPSGRIMNRFSKDIGCMDDPLPNHALWSIQMCLYALVAFLVPAATNFWLIFASFPVLAMVLYISRYYLKSSRELKRLEAVRCSPVYAHISETVLGLEVIHASGMAPHFMDKFYRYQDESTQATFFVLASANWMSLRIDTMSSLMVIVVAIASVLSTQNPALVGLAVVYTLETFNATQFAIKMAAATETLMTAVERVMTYTKLMSEPGYNTPVEPHQSWPSEGELQVKNMSFVYLEGGPKILKNVSFTIKAKEKVGVAGRTGAGKSSLVAALLRMPDCQGEVLIDGVDIGALNLQAARRAVAVITQDPVLFSGTLRKNLDPFSTFMDVELWGALEGVQLKSFVENLPGQLQFRLKESGSNFSVGERQLLCLARTLLQKTRIIIMDEATANVDFKTDQLIQEVIRRKFKNCTVLTIAHRLNTIMDYDKVLVLDEGRVVEFDKTDVLLADKNSLFSRLVQGSQRVVC